LSYEIVFSALGGLGMFLFGMQMMASGLQKAAGDRFRRILEVLTNKPVLGVLTGVVVTLLVQSSSTVSVMVVGFANAGLMSLIQAISVIIGTNIGTTITAQVISFNIGVIAYPAIGIGALLNFFGRRKAHRYFGQAVLGFGLLFLGLSTMSGGLSPLRELETFHDLLVKFSIYPVLGVIFGAIFTALIQSSSAATGVIIALTIQNLIPLEAAVPLVLGTNIGTSITAVLAAIGANLSARRTAVAHVIFNVVGVAVVLIFIGPFTELVAQTASSVPRQVANVHTAFNLTSTIIFLLFIKQFAYIVCRIVPGEEYKVEYGPKFLDPRMLRTPAVAIGGVRQELLRMAGLAREMLHESLQVLRKKDLKRIKHIEQMEEILDSLETEVYTYLAELSQHSMTREQSIQVCSLMSAANDLERIGDHAENIMQLSEIMIEKGNSFSTTAVEEITAYYEQVDRMLEKTIEAFELNDSAIAEKVIEEDDLVDQREKDLRNKHIERINSQKCTPAAGVIYLDILSNLERVADHANNIADLVAENRV